MNGAKSPLESARLLLLQIRNPDDRMRHQEVHCFCRALEIAASQLDVFDLLSGPLTPRHVNDYDMLLIGGAGEYSAAGEGDWLNRALDSLRVVHESGTPTFGSCWGFQAMARALGGTVVNDVSRAEVGTHELFLTPSGRNDAVFQPLGDTFQVQMGHEDLVEELPPNAELLASSPVVKNQAYRFTDRPIYCTQFHPELRTDDLRARVGAYPEYLHRIAGLTLEEFSAQLQETPETESLLKRFALHALG